MVVSIRSGLMDMFMGLRRTTNCGGVFASAEKLRARACTALLASMIASSRSAQATLIAVLMKASG